MEHRRAPLGSTNPQILGEMKTAPCIAFLLSILPLAWVCSQSNTVGTIAYDPALYSDGYTLIYPHN